MTSKTKNMTGPDVPVTELVAIAVAGVGLNPTPGAADALTVNDLGLVAVTFHVGYRGYGAGETAGFEPGLAGLLVEKGVAVPFAPATQSTPGPDTEPNPPTP